MNVEMKFEANRKVWPDLDEIRGGKENSRGHLYIPQLIFSSSPLLIPPSHQQTFFCVETIIRDIWTETLTANDKLINRNKWTRLLE